jgi:ribonuclease P protein component
MIFSQLIRDLARHEKNLSTQQFEAQAHARLPRAHEYEERPGRHQRTSCEGPRAAGGLNPHPLRCNLARFPRQVRLTRPAEYRRVFDYSQCKVTNRWMTVLATPNSCHTPRLGLVISRKAAGCAVKRNRIKRLVRESFRQRQTALESLDIVVIGRAGISTRPNSELAESLEKIWKRLIESCARC